MDRNSADLGWSDEQWSRANKVVQEEAQKARVAAQFLPSVVHPDAVAVAVPNHALTYRRAAPMDPRRRMLVDANPTTHFTSLAVNVVLTSQEGCDPEQASALIQLKRAANLIARAEDALLLRGQAGPRALVGVGRLPAVFEVGMGARQPGLLADPDEPPRNYGRRVQVNPGPDGRTLAARIITATSRLEARGHNRPFACILGNTLYDRLHDPTASMILPRDRVAPALEGPILRSSTLPAEQGIVVALGGSPIEIVVSSELHVKFLQVTTEPRYVLRVSERLALRVTEWNAIAALHPGAPEADDFEVEYDQEDEHAEPHEHQ